MRIFYNLRKYCGWFALLLLTSLAHPASTQDIPEWEWPLYLDLDQKLGRGFECGLYALDLNSGELNQVQSLNCPGYRGGSDNGWSSTLRFSHDGQRVAMDFKQEGKLKKLGITKTSIWELQEVILLERLPDESKWDGIWLPGDKFILLTYMTPKTIDRTEKIYDVPTTRLLIHTDTLETQLWPYEITGIAAGPTLQWAFDPTLRIANEEYAPYVFYNLSDQTMTPSEIPLQQVYYLANREIVSFKAWLWSQEAGFIWYHWDLPSQRDTSDLIAEQGFYLWKEGVSEPARLFLPLRYWTTLHLSPDSQRILFSSDFGYVIWPVFNIAKQNIDHTFRYPRDESSQIHMSWIDSDHYVYHDRFFSTPQGEQSIHLVSIKDGPQRVYTVQAESIHEMIYPN